MANKKNYSKISTKMRAEEVIEPSSEIMVETSTTVEEPAIKRGRVVNCSLLNIRKEPKITAAIVGTLDKGESVTVWYEVGEFYRIGNPDGDEYCMKKFISIDE